MRKITESGIVNYDANASIAFVGLDKSTSIDAKTQRPWFAATDAQRFFVDTFDLYAARVRNAFTEGSRR